MFELPEYIRRVNLIFKFMNRQDLAPSKFQESERPPVRIQQPGDRHTERFSHKQGTTSSSRSRILLDGFPKLLRNQDFALVRLLHGSNVRPNRDTEYGCKFLFVRDGDTAHRDECRRLADLEGLLRDTKWNVYARVFEERPDMLVVTCASPRSVT